MAYEAKYLMWVNAVVWVAALIASLLISFSRSWVVIAAPSLAVVTHFFILFSYWRDRTV